MKSILSIIIVLISLQLIICLIEEENVNTNAERIKRSAQNSDSGII